MKQTYSSSPQSILVSVDGLAVPSPPLKEIFENTPRLKGLPLAIARDFMNLWTWYQNLGRAAAGKRCE